VRRRGYAVDSKASWRKQEIGRLRMMAANSAAEGDTKEARKLDRMADELSQMPLFAPKAPRKPDPSSTLPVLFPEEEDAS
jgi:hypothetical protein